MHADSAEVTRGIASLGRQLPDTMRAFAGLHQAAMADGAISAATKELIALAVSIVEGCDGCIAHHADGAVKRGATRAQLLEAIGVAVLMGGGPATVHGADALAHVERLAPAAA